MSIHELFVYLRAKDAGQAISFYCKAFGATEKFRLVEPGGRIGHAELAFGEASVYISDEFPEMGVHAPKPNADSTFIMHLHVDDADAMIAKAVKEGATLLRKAEDQFYGERSGTVRDPFGYDWLIGHALEEVEPEEMQRRYDALFSDT
jgi:uncharacterized glyoxalase superfamily protein PhnB